MIPAKGKKDARCRIQTRSPACGRGTHVSDSHLCGQCQVNKCPRSKHLMVISQAFHGRLSICALFRRMVVAVYDPAATWRSVRFRPFSSFSCSRVSASQHLSLRLSHRQGINHFPETIMEKNLHLDLRGYATDYRAIITQTLQTNQLLEVRPIFVVFAFDRAAYCFRGDV
jgi:hypothetical protein